MLSEGTVEQELRASLAALRLASPEPLVAFSHHVLDKLMRLVVQPPIIGGQMGERTPPNPHNSLSQTRCVLCVSSSILEDGHPSQPPLTLKFYDPVTSLGQHLLFLRKVGVEQV